MSRDFEQAGWTTEAGQRVSGQTVIIFHKGTRKHNYKSKLAGRDIYEDVIYLTKIPGDQYNRPTRPMRESDKEEFPREWEQFVRTGEGKPLGFPIDQWPSLSETQKMEFKSVGIVTIEQLAGASDLMLQKFMGGQELRQKAKVFLEAGKDAELVAKIKMEANAEVEAMRKKMEAMEERMNEFMEKQTQPTGKK